MNKPRYFDIKQQRKNFLLGVFLSPNPQITERGKACANSLGVGAVYRRIVKDTQKELPEALLFPPEIDIFDQEPAHKIAYSALSQERKKHIAHIHDIYLQKIEDHCESLEVGSLNDSDHQECFDQAYKEFSSFYPHEHHDDIFLIAQSFCL